MRRLGQDRVRELTISGQRVLEVKANYEEFEKMDLGMPTDEMQAVNDAGFYVVARPTNYRQCTKDDELALRMYAGADMILMPSLIVWMAIRYQQLWLLVPRPWEHLMNLSIWLSRCASVA